MTTQIISDEASTRVINAKLITVIANSRAEHSIYTYSTSMDNHFHIKNEGFFDPVYTFALVGDIFRIFRYEEEELVTYYEFVVTKVDKIAKKVSVVNLFEKSLKKKA